VSLPAVTIAPSDPGQRSVGVDEVVEMVLVPMLELDELELAVEELLEEDPTGNVPHVPAKFAVYLNVSANLLVPLPLTTSK
jgi:hypothetical protein